MNDTSTALHFGDCIPQHIAEKEQVVASHVYSHTQKHTYTRTYTQLRSASEAPQNASEGFQKAALKGIDRKYDFRI